MKGESHDINMPWPKMVKLLQWYHKPNHTLAIVIVMMSPTKFKHLLMVVRAGTSSGLTIKTITTTNTFPSILCINAPFIKVGGRPINKHDKIPIFHRDAYVNICLPHDITSTVYINNT